MTDKDVPRNGFAVAGFPITGAKGSLELVRRQRQQILAGVGIGGLGVTEGGRHRRKGAQDNVDKRRV